MIRNLKRLTLGVEEALQTDRLSEASLSLLQPYQPSLTVTWLFQKAMSVDVNQKIQPNQINELLSVVFAEMQKLGEPVLKPFLQDVVQFGGLTKTLFKTSLANPGLIIKIIPQVGLITLIDWMWHYINLGVYSLLFNVSRMLEPLIINLPENYQYYWHRWVDAWKFGSGNDYDE